MPETFEKSGFSAKRGREEGPGLSESQSCYGRAQVHLQDARGFPGEGMEVSSELGVILTYSWMLSKEVTGSFLHLQLGRRLRVAEYSPLFSETVSEVRMC